MTSNERELPKIAESYPIDQLRLDSSTYTILKNAHIRTVGEIVKLEQEHRLLRVRNLGKRHYQAIETALEELGIALKESVVADQKPPKGEDDPKPGQVKAETGPKTAVFVDFEHWYISLQEIHRRKPNLQTWFDDLRTRGQLLDVLFFGDFSDSSGMRDELDHIRRFSNHIVETTNIRPHAKANFTDFIMLDNIYQKVISSPEIEQIVLFTGDSDFCSVASYLRNFCGKTVGVYGVDNAISSQLEVISNWCVRLPFSNEPVQECRIAILRNLRYAESHTKQATFRPTVRLVSEHYDLPEDAVEAELRLMLGEGLVYTLPERNRRDYTVMLNVLHVKWELVKDIEL